MSQANGSTHIECLNLSALPYKKLPACQLLPIFSSLSNLRPCPHLQDPHSHSWACPRFAFLASPALNRRPDHAAAPGQLDGLEDEKLAVPFDQTDGHSAEDAGVIIMTPPAAATMSPALGIISRHSSADTIPTDPSSINQTPDSTTLPTTTENNNTSNGHNQDEEDQTPSRPPQVSQRTSGTLHAPLPFPVCGRAPAVSAFSSSAGSPGHRPLGSAILVPGTQSSPRPPRIDYNYPPGPRGSSGFGYGAQPWGRHSPSAPSAPSAPSGAEPATLSANNLLQHFLRSSRTGYCGLATPLAAHRFESSPLASLSHHPDRTYTSRRVRLSSRDETVQALPFRTGGRSTTPLFPLTPASTNRSVSPSVHQPDPLRPGSYRPPVYGVQPTGQESRSGSEPSPTPSANLPEHARPNFFRPMHGVGQDGQEHRVHRPQQASQLARQNMMRGFSPWYLGNTSLTRNKSADIPDHENCSLFLLGLPAKVTTHELLASIRDVGRIWAMHINPPELGKGHLTAAAKVIFFTRAAAERFWDRFAPTGFAVAAHPGCPPARVLWNRIKTGAQTGQGAGIKSRVLLIRGPDSFVNPDALSAYFDTKFKYQVDEIISLLWDRGSRVRLVEYRFGSYRCQAEAAKMALSREFDAEVRVWYGTDPCDVRAEEEGKDAADSDLPTTLRPEPLECDDVFASPAARVTASAGFAFPSLP